jgi:hypothetical protein
LYRCCPCKQVKLINAGLTGLRTVVLIHIS